MAKACTFIGYSCTNGGWIEGTRTSILQNYSDPGYQLFAHEVGHTYGIYDCTGADCLPAVTTMQPQTDPHSSMSPHCCDSKLMNEMSHGYYGQSANNCSATFVQGTAATSQQQVNSQPVTFQQPPQSGDSIVVGCLGEYATSFTVMDNQAIQGQCNQGACNTYNGVVSVDVTLPPPAVGTIAETALLITSQEVSSQSQPFTVTCSTASGGPGYISAFAVEYADLGTWSNLDGSPMTNTSQTGVSPLSCGSLTTSATNDLISSLYNWNQFPLIQSDRQPLAAALGEAQAPRVMPPDSCTPQYNAATTPGTIATCSGGNGGNCIFGNSGVSQYPMNTPGQYTESWTAWLDPAGCQAINPMACVSAAFKVIGP